MTVTVAAFIIELDLEYSNAYDDAFKVKCLNDIEAGIYEDINEEFRTQYYTKVKGTYQYTLPSGYNWEDVREMYVDNKRYRKMNVNSNNENGSFYYDDSKINIYPVPTLNDVTYTSIAADLTFKAISYTSGASELTFTHNTITTSGTAFTSSAFVVGNSLWIKGCIDTNNNKVVVITGVAASVLTFDDYTLDPDTTADTGVINIATNCIYTSGAEFDGFISGDMTLVADCSDKTANNKYAKVFAKADQVLTFPLGTFTAQAESAAVTITQPKIKMTYRYRRTVKTAANKATEYLLLPARFEMAYYDYCMGMMAKLDREWKEAANFLDSYNSTMDDYEKWWEERRPQKAHILPTDSWGSPYDNSSNDDE